MFEGPNFYQKNKRIVFLHIKMHKAYTSALPSCGGGGGGGGGGGVCVAIMYQMYL